MKLSLPIITGLSQTEDIIAKTILITFILNKMKETNTKSIKFTLDEITKEHPYDQLFNIESTDQILSSMLDMFLDPKESSSFTKHHKLITTEKVTKARTSSDLLHEMTTTITFVVYPVKKWLEYDLKFLKETYIDIL